MRERDHSRLRERDRERSRDMIKLSTQRLTKNCYILSTLTQAVDTANERERSRDMI